MRPYRSLLFVPGHKPGWVDKALRAGPDAIVLDLEDSVPDEQKPAARKAVARIVTRLHEAGETTGIFIRPNALATRMTGADLEAAITPGLTGIFMPKINQAADVHRLDGLVDYLETRSGTTGMEYIIPAETVAAIQDCRAIAQASPRTGAMVGPTAEHADIAREVGFEWTPDGAETLYLRSRVLLACREAGLHPLTGLWEDLCDTEGLKVFATQGRRLGYRGMIVIHPSHVAPVNEAFSPTAEQTAFYQGLAEAYEAAAARGDGAARYRGLHVDRAHYDKAQEWLAMARQIGELPGGRGGRPPARPAENPGD